MTVLLYGGGAGGAMVICGGDGGGGDGGDGGDGHLVAVVS